MFNVSVDKFNVQFTFTHMRNVGEGVGITDVTSCDLYINGEQFTGVAACSKHDVFNKEVGRKIALKRAIEAVRTKVELPQIVRECVWQRYFGRHIANDMFAVYDSTGIVARGLLNYALPHKPSKVGSNDLVNMA
jgi:hypothetical protein